jgi:hypothetical protein
LWVVGGRRGGKDSIASLIITHAAINFNGKRRTIAGITLPALRSGERATAFCFGPDRDTARIVLDYVKGYFQDIPQLASLVTRQTRDGFELATGLDVIIAASDFRGVRGRAVLSVVMDETAMMRDEYSSKPDTELYAAVKPDTLMLRDQSMIIGISTPLTKTGLLYQKFVKHYGKDDDEVLVVRATSQSTESIARRCDDCRRDRRRPGEEPFRVFVRSHRPVCGAIALPSLRYVIVTPQSSVDRAIFQGHARTRRHRAPVCFVPIVFVMKIAI